MTNILKHRRVIVREKRVNSIFLGFFWVKNAANCKYAREKTSSYVGSKIQKFKKLKKHRVITGEWGSAQIKIEKNRTITY